MNEQVTGGNRRAGREVDEPTADAGAVRRRSRLRLRHEAAMVVAEIQRMRRVSWSDPSADGAGPGAGPATSHY